MQSPTTVVAKALAQTQVVQQSAANLEAAHPDVPRPKLAEMFARCLVGVPIALVGLALMWFLALKPQLDKTGTTTTLLVGVGAGLAVFAWGVLTISTQLAGTPLATVLSAFRGVWNSLRPGGGAAAG